MVIKRAGLGSNPKNDDVEHISIRFQKAYQGNSLNIAAKLLEDQETDIDDIPLNFLKDAVKKAVKNNHTSAPRMIKYISNNYRDPGKVFLLVLKESKADYHKSLLEWLQTEDKIQILESAIEENDIDIAKIILNDVKNSANILNENFGNDDDVAFDFAIYLDAYEIALELYHRGFQSKKLDSSDWVGFIAYLLKNHKGDIAKKIMEDLGFDEVIFAALTGDIDKIKKLVENGENYNSKDSDNKNALIHASSQGFADIVEYLVQKGIDVNEKGRGDTTALIEAANSHESEVVEALLKAGAEPNLQNSDGKTALDICLEKKYYDTAAILIQNKATINVHADEVYKLIIQLQSPEPNEYSSSSEIDQDDRSDSSALENDSEIEFSSDEISSSSEIDQDATSDSSSQEYESETEYDDTSSSESDFVVDFSAERQNSEKRSLSELLMSEYNITELMLLVYDGDLNKIKSYLNGEHNTYAKDKAGNTAVSLAIRLNKTNVLRELLDKNTDESYIADIIKEVANKEYVHFSIIKLLLDLYKEKQHLNDIEKSKYLKGLDNETIMGLAMHALNAQDEEIFRDLFESSEFDINYSDDKGDTLLHKASRLKAFFAVKTLLEKKANPLLKNRHDQLPVTLTRDEAITIELKKVGNDRNSRLQQIAFVYDKALDSMSKMIILGLDEKAAKQSMQKVSYEVISNNEGYNLEDTSDLYDIKGKRLEVVVDGISYPIGYNIHMPNPSNDNNILNNVIIEVYGGKTRQFQATKPNDLQGIGDMAISNNQVYITLNLPDLRQDLLQQEMDEKLQKIIHAAIHQFYKTIKDKPGEISETLPSRLEENTRFFLYGASFGGRTAIRHGQLYPKTFDGYISHDGVLADLKDKAIVGEREYIHRREIFPSYHVADSEEPMLILHNRDDNNINIATSLDFYEKLKESNKDHLARLCFFDKGSPGFKDDTGNQRDNYVNKGHFIPENKESYFNALLKFMQHGPTVIPEINDFVFVAQRNKVQQNYRQSDITERFCALAIDKFEKQHSIRSYKKSLSQFGIIWDKEYCPILRALGEIKVMIDEPSFSYCQSYMQYLNDQQLLSDEVIKNALKHHASVVKEFYREFLNQNIELEAFYENPFVIEKFRSKLLELKSEENAEYKSFLLESLFIANPNLLPTFDQSKAWDEVSFKESSDNARERFDKSISMQQQSARASFRATITHMRGLLKSNSTQTGNTTTSSAPVKNELQSKKARTHKKTNR